MGFRPGEKGDLSSERRPVIEVPLQNLRRTSRVNAYDTVLDVDELLSKKAQSGAYIDSLNPLSPIYFRGIELNDPAIFELKGGATSQSVSRLFKLHLKLTTSPGDVGLLGKMSSLDKVLMMQGVVSDLRDSLAMFRDMLESSNLEDAQKVPQMLLLYAPHLMREIESLGIFSKVESILSAGKRRDVVKINMYGMLVDSESLDKAIKQLEKIRVEKLYPLVKKLNEREDRV